MVAVRADAAYFRFCIDLPKSISRRSSWTPMRWQQQARLVSQTQIRPGRLALPELLAGGRVFVCMCKVEREREGEGGGGCGLRMESCKWHLQLGG